MKIFLDRTIFLGFIGIGFFFATARPVTGATVTVSEGSFFFSPQTVDINVNDTVEWNNVGFHTVTSDTGLFGSEVSYQTFQFTFTSPGTFGVHCAIHPFMTGSVNVSGPTAVPPSVTIQSPSDGLVFDAPANFNLMADASDSDGTVTQVEFFKGTTSLGIALLPQYSAGVGPLSSGTYAFSAVASDNSGLKATNAITIIVNDRPTVAVTNLPSTAVFTPPATVVVKATAADTDGTVASVEFFNGATSLGTATGPVYQKTLSNLGVGSYVIQVIATDNRGSTAVASVTVVVTSIKLTSPVKSAGQFQLQVGGLVPGKTNLVQTSTNLTTWVNLSTNVAASATTPVTDSSATNAFKFYRVIELP